MEWLGDLVLLNTQHWLEELWNPWTGSACPTHRKPITDTGWQKKVGIYCKAQSNEAGSYCLIPRLPELGVKKVHIESESSRCARVLVGQWSLWPFFSLVSNATIFREFMVGSSLSDSCMKLVTSSPELSPNESPPVNTGQVGSYLLEKQMIPRVLWLEACNAKWSLT